MKSLLLAAILTLSACQPIRLAGHEHRLHRRFLQAPNRPFCGDLICNDCGLAVASWIYWHPFMGPPEGFKDTDEVRVVIPREVVK